MRQTFTTSGAQAPVAKYSQAARIGPVVAIAGQGGLRVEVTALAVSH